MTMITATFTGQRENLVLATTFAIHFASRTRIKRDKLTVEYHCENEDYDQARREVQECIDLGEIERLECDLVSIW